MGARSRFALKPSERVLSGNRHITRIVCQTASSETACALCKLFNSLVFVHSFKPMPACIPTRPDELHTVIDSCVCPGHNAKLEALNNLKEAADTPPPPGLEVIIAPVIPPLIALLEGVPVQWAPGPAQDVRHTALDLLSRLASSPEKTRVSHRHIAGHERSLFQDHSTSDIRDYA